MKKYRLERAITLKKPRTEIFPFFADARNLERITPGFLRFRILTPGPITIHAGTYIDYELRLSGIPFRWRTLIEEFTPNESFVDVQISGPYKSWHHRHEFRDVPGGTEMRDTVDYELPFGVFGSIAHALFVRRSLKHIFDHRNETVKQIFNA